MKDGVRIVAVAIAAALMACAAERPPPPDEGPFVRRPLSPELLARKAIAYSGYRRDQSPDAQRFPSKEEIEEDLRLLVAGGWGFIRIFDSGPHAERVLAVISEKQLDLRVLLGVWIAGGPAQHDAKNRAEIDRGVALATQYQTIVAAVSVGNETLDDWSNVKTTPDELVTYINEVRRRVTQPVTTDDSWLPFTLGQDGATNYADVIKVMKAVDFLSLHVYAFADAFYESWEWKQEAVPAELRARAMMDAAMAYTRYGVRAVRVIMDSHQLDLPVVIGEAGWKDATPFSPNNPADRPEDAIEHYFSHPVNQKWFYDDLMRWVYGDGRDGDSPSAAFYFEAFDEPWKGEWGDDGWGLFNVDRVPKYVVWDLFPDRKPAGAPTYTDADAVHYYR